MSMLAEMVIVELNQTAPTFLTGCKITDHAKSKCIGQNICVVDMESYLTFLASIFMYMLEM